MRHFVTLFDSRFMSQGLCLYQSMSRFSCDWKLWILCIDNEVYRWLLELNLENIALLKLEELETQELLSVKSNRTSVEYCWTLTPYAPRFVFEADPTVGMVTYVDADLYFLSEIDPLLALFESSEKGVLITRHGFPEGSDQAAVSGEFCVQFVTFDRVLGERVRSWWEAKCIEWCFNRVEDGRFGDQKYLDYWPSIFGSSVFIVDDPCLTVGPWNLSLVGSQQALFYHFHGLRYISNGLFKVGDYTIKNEEFYVLYLPYLNTFMRTVKILEAQGFKQHSQCEVSWIVKLGLAIWNGVFGVRPLGKFIRCNF